MSHLPHTKVLHKSSVFSRWHVPASTTTCIIDIQKNTTIPLTQRTIRFFLFISLLFFFLCHSLSYLPLLRQQFQNKSHETRVTSIITTTTITTTTTTNNKKCDQASEQFNSIKVKTSFQVQRASKDSTRGCQWGGVNSNKESQVCYSRVEARFQDQKGSSAEQGQTQ